MWAGIDPAKPPHQVTVSGRETSENIPQSDAGGAPAYPQPPLPFVGRVMELHLPERYAVDHTILQLFSDLLCGALHETTRYTMR